MRRWFTKGQTPSQIARHFRHARFGGRRTCVRCGSRCRRLFGLLTGTWLARSRLSLAAWYELLFWYAHEVTPHKAAQEAGLPAMTVHRAFRTIRRACAVRGRPGRGRRCGGSSRPMRASSARSSRTGAPGPGAAPEARRGQVGPGEPAGPAARGRAL